ncbi:MAG: glycoside hydrolase family 13 protein [Blautia sp.]|nr:glycoside hydrolase family 13 protein [Blautia sp.]
MSQVSADVMTKMRYIMNMRPVLNMEALFSDGSVYYRQPAQPQAGDTLTIRFRTQRNNVDAVFLVSSDTRLEMRLCGTSNGFDYFEVSLAMPDEVFRYHFEILYGWKVCYYTYNGPGIEWNPDSEFEIYPGFDIPDWAKGAVMYQIFVDRFCNGDPSNDVENGEYYYIGDLTTKVEDWAKIPEVMGVREFYGGDLAGVLQKLDYLKDLGVEVIYLNPIFVSPSNHKYDIQDYDYIDPHYGKIVYDTDEGILNREYHENSKAKKFIRRVTDKRNLEASNEFFIQLVKEIHKRGMRVILDGVFNHCGSFNKWMDRERIYENEAGYEKGAYISADSPYRHYFQFSDPNQWPYNPSYDGWWAHDTLPKLNYEESPSLCEEILRIGRKWVSAPFNVDGWRLDVAADLGHSNEFNHSFWQRFRQEVKKANPEALILAEHYGNPESWLRGNEWDTVMNYDAFMEPVSWFLTGMEKHSDEYREDMWGNSEALIFAMKVHMRFLHMSSLYAAMNELSNHDHSRFLTRTNHHVGRIAYSGALAASENVNPAIMREAVVFQMTWPGSPTVYYGDEAGVCGFTDPDNRRTYPWGMEDKQMLAFHREMIALHNRYDFLRDGSVRFLWNDYQGLAFGRFSHTERLIVIVNNQQTEREVEIEAWKTGLSRLTTSTLTRLMLSWYNGYTMEPAQYPAEGGIVRVCVPGYGALVLYHKCENPTLFVSDRKNEKK